MANNPELERERFAGAIVIFPVNQGSLSIKVAKANFRVSLPHTMTCVSGVTVKALLFLTACKSSCNTDMFVGFLVQR